MGARVFSEVQRLFENIFPRLKTSRIRFTKSLIPVASKKEAQI
jgi:hypothetical protein